MMNETILGGLEFALWIAFIYLLASPRTGVLLWDVRQWAERKVEEFRP